jgi:hypothetical protein
MLHRLFFRPKWQNRNPRIRLEGVLELRPGDSRLTDLARSDPDAAVRRQAVRRLSDLAMLAECRSNDTDASVREAAHKRLCLVLSGEEDVGIGVAALEAATREFMDDATALHLIHHAAAESVRRVALARIDRQSVFAEVALGDPSPELRVAALERIDQPATLERVARTARGRDKRLARMAREKADALRAAEERPRRQQEICENLEHLVAGGVPDIVRYHELEAAWNEVRRDAPEAVAARVETARAAFERLNAQRQEAATHLSNQRELCDRAESLAGEVRVVTSPEAGQIASSRKALEVLETSWAALVDETEEVNAACAARFAAAVAEMRRRLPALEAVFETHRRFEALAADARRVAEGDGLPSEKQLRDIEERWHAFAARHGKAMPHAVRDRFDLAVARARERIGQAREKEHALAAEFDRLADRLESALEAGELQHAISLHDKARDRLDKLAAVAPRQAQRGKRLNRIGMPLRELRDWRRYGVGQVREELIRRMQELVGADVPPNRLATEIRGLQEEWRSLDRKSGPAGEELWAAFSAAAQEARKPCEAHFEKLAAEHAANAEARAGFCDDLEASLAGVNWDEPDWGTLERKVRDSRSRWRELGGVEPAQWQNIDRRFRDILGRFEERLAPERQRERQRRERLIANIEALADEPDLRKAVAEVKAAQAAWQPTVPGARKVEQALWKRFRAASDAIFARRDAERAEHERALEEQAAERTRLCEAAEALSATEPESWARARTDWAALRAAWAELPAMPSRRKGALERRFDAAVAAFERAERAAVARAASEEEERWAERARLCAELEARLDSDTAGEARGDAGRRWAELPSLADETLQAMFEDRFSRTCRALDGDAAERDALKNAREANLASCRRLCLELEILAGIDSPADAASERLALQVERLPQAMMSGNRGAAERREELRSLLKKCYLAGPLPPGVAAPTLDRVERAREAFANPPASAQG